MRCPHVGSKAADCQESTHPRAFTSTLARASEPSLAGFSTRRSSSATRIRRTSFEDRRAAA
jgi:hypothetical protein